MRRLLWIGDAGVPSGFARATHETLDVLKETWDVTVLGMNYRGDPHPYPYPIYAALPGGDALGVGRLLWMLDSIKPDAIIIQNDPWHLPHYMRQLATAPEYSDIPVIAALAVDGANCRGDALNGLSLCIFWTEFGLGEARAGGYRGPAAVIPLGVDLGVYRPGDRLLARKRRHFPKAMEDVFVVGNVNRNQPRKRMDLSIRFFANWCKTRKVDDAYLYLHVAPTGEKGIDVNQLAAYYGILPNVILMAPEMFYGLSEEEMADTYRSFDVQITTTQGEGFGLTTFEGMACGIPQIVPRWSALQELTQGAAMQVDCSSTSATMDNINAIGGIADEEKFINALDHVYRNADSRHHLAETALRRAVEPRFRWPNIGKRFEVELDKVMDPILAEKVG